MDIRAFLAEQMGFFTFHDVPGVLFGIVVAALLSLLMGRLFAAPEGPRPAELSLWSAMVAFGVSFVRASLPLSIAFAAVLLLFRPQPQRGGSLHAIAVMLGLACGAGATLIVLMVVVPLGLFARILSRR